MIRIQRIINMKPRPSPEIDIDIDIRSTDWQIVDGLSELASTCILAAREQFCPRAFSEISLVFSDNVHVQILNREYRGQDKPTNVLSFPTNTQLDIPVLGDIVLALETVKLEAEQQIISLENHISHLLIHGYLHLQGLDHENEQDAQEMESLEIKLLAGLGISNPYDKEIM